MAKAKKLPSGNWRTRIFDYEDSQGKKHYKSFTSPSKRESEYLAMEYRIKHKATTPNEMEIKDIVKKFIDEREPYISPTTTRTYLMIYNTHISNIKTKVCDWTATLHQEWINNLKKAPKTIKNINGLLVSALKYYGITVPKVNLPQKKYEPIKIPTTSEIKLIIKYFEHREEFEMVKAIYLSSMGTLRRGEICALQKEDIDRKNNTISITKSQAIDKDEKLIIKEPKTYTSNRLVELPEFVIKLLLQNSKPVDLTVLQITEKWKYCMKHLKMNYTFHSLRHYSASIMHAQNIPTQYIMERGGWKTESTLNRIYRNSLDDYSKMFSQKTNNYFENNFL